MRRMFKNEIQALIEIVKTSDFYRNIIINEPDQNSDASRYSRTEYCFHFGASNGVWDYSQVHHDQGFNIIEEKKSLSEAEVFKMLFDMTQNLSKEDAVWLHPMGTHCGGLSFQFGWVHSTSNSDDKILAAVMPQQL